MSRPLCRPCVMVVEDDDCARLAICRMFTLHRCTAIAAPSLAVAVAALSREWLVIDAIILDLWLADGRGEAVLALARNVPRLAAVRVVVHSGACDRRMTDGLLARGASAVVPKPSGFAELWAAAFPGVPG